MHNIAQRYVPNDPGVTHNIALLRLETEIVYTASTFSIALPAHEVLKNDGPLTVTGWGATSNTVNQSNNLKVSTGNYVDWVENATICVKSANGWPCMGDGGGGLVKAYTNDYFQLVGVLTEGPLVCDDGRPRAYSSVYFHLQWIHDFAHMDPDLDPYGCSDSNENPPAERRIWDGKEAKLGEIPYAVIIVNIKERPFCSGSIISKKTVLTSGHCVPRACYVYSGTVDVEAPLYIHYIEEIHRYNNKSEIIQDIGTIIVMPSFDFNTYVQPIPLTNVEVKPGDGPMKVAGIGFYSLDRRASRFLRFSDNNTVTKLSSVHPGLVCERAEDGRQELSGDSGAGLVLNGKLVCIHTGGGPAYVKYTVNYCCSIFYFKTWIEEHMEKD